MLSGKCNTPYNAPCNTDNSKQHGFENSTLIKMLYFFSGDEQPDIKVTWFWQDFLRKFFDHLQRSWPWQDALARRWKGTLQCYPHPIWIPVALGCSRGKRESLAIPKRTRTNCFEKGKEVLGKLENTNPIIRFISSTKGNGTKTKLTTAQTTASNFHFLLWTLFPNFLFSSF